MSRALRDQLLFHVLALDWSDVQTQGAARREASNMNRKPTQGRRAEADHCAGRPLANGSLTYLTTRIDPGSLLASTNAWLEDISLSNYAATVHAPVQVTPVLFVALHACGSLTLDILRAFASANRSNPSTPSSFQIPWDPQGAIIVGCCYNMMRSEGGTLTSRRRPCSLYLTVIW